MCYCCLERLLSNCSCHFLFKLSKCISVALLGCCHFIELAFITVVNLIIFFNTLCLFLLSCCPKLGILKLTLSWKGELNWRSRKILIKFFATFFLFFEREPRKLVNKWLGIIDCSCASPVHTTLYTDVWSLEKLVSFVFPRVLKFPSISSRGPPVNCFPFDFIAARSWHLTGNSFIFRCLVTMN